MSKFNLKGFMNCEHEFTATFKKFSPRGVETREMCVKCGMDRRMDEPVKQLIEVEDGRRKREGISSEE